MSSTTEKQNGQPTRRSESRSDTARSTSAKVEGALFTLTAGTIGLGITLLEQERAEAAVKAGDLDLDGLLGTDLATTTDPMADAAAILDHVTYDGQSLPANVTVAGPAETPGEASGLADFFMELLALYQPAAVESAGDEAGGSGAPTQAQDASHTASVAGAESIGADTPEAEQLATTVHGQNGDPGFQPGSHDGGTGAEIPHFEGATGQEVPRDAQDTGGGTSVSGETGPHSREDSDGAQDDAPGDLAGGGEDIQSEAVSAITETTGNLGDVVGGLLGGGENGEGLLPGAVSTVTETAENVTDMAGGLLGGLGDTLGGLLNGGEESGGIVSTVTETIGGLGDALGDLLGGGEDGDGIVTDTLSLVSGTIENLADSVSSLLGGGEEGEGVLSTVTETVENLADTAGDLLGGIGNTVSGLLGGGEEDESPASDVVSSISQAVDGLGDAVGDLSGGGEDGERLLSETVSAATNTVEDLADAAGNVIGDVTDVAGSLLGGIGNAVGGLLGGGIGGTESIANAASSDIEPYATADNGPTGDVQNSEGDFITASTVTNAADGVLVGAASLVEDSLDGTQNDAAGSPSSSLESLEQEPAMFSAAYDSDYGDVHSGGGQPNMFEAVGQMLEFTDGLVGALVPKIGFTGQPDLQTDQHHDTDNPHGSLFHLHI